ncbi:MAG: hypothetical protein ACRC8S_02830 [Fimbriiglobus sp.]
MRSVFRQLQNELVLKRNYLDDDFRSVLVATQDRARLPYGTTSLMVAYQRTLKKPIRLTQPEFVFAELPAIIAGIAYELSLLGKEGEPILLPVDAVRDLLKQRKIVVSGAINRLIESGILVDTGKKYRTGHAREFKFAGKLNVNFEFSTDISASAESKK